MSAKKIPLFSQHTDIYKNSTGHFSKRRDRAPKSLELAVIRIRTPIHREVMKIIKILTLGLVISLATGCATIVNDANIPLVFSFSDGSSGHCTFKNKRGTWESDLPTVGVYIRRSDDALIYDCNTKDGREVTGSVRSEMEGGKLAASVVFWDLGITDAITDKHRTYQGNVVIPVQPKEEEVTPDK